MPKPGKIEAVKEITADLKTTDVYFFVDYRGLTFAEATDLRGRLAKADTSLKVVKNTLAKIAATDAGVEGLEDLLKGPTAIAYVRGDAVQAAKIIQDFIKEKKKSTVRGGKLQRQMLDASGIEKLATLPSREQLIAQLVGAMASPLQGLANVLNGPIRGLVVVLGQIQEKQSAA